MRKKALERLRSLPKLPGFIGKIHRDIEIIPASEDSEAIVVRVHKARAARTVPVSASLLSLLGQELTQLFAHDDDESEEDDRLAQILGTDIDDPASMKTAFLGVVMPMLQGRMRELTKESGTGSIPWFLDRMLSGNVEYEGVRLETMEEIEHVGFSVPQMIRMFWTAMELAFFPPQGDPDIEDGESSPGSPETETTPNEPSSSEETEKMTGRSVKMSNRTG